MPYLGPGVLSGVTEAGSGEAIPADSDSLILAMNGGKPMAPRLMFEFARAAMDMELKKGRNFVYRFLSETYGERQWTRCLPLSRPDTLLAGRTLMGTSFLPLSTFTTSCWVSALNWPFCNSPWRSYA